MIFGILRMWTTGLLALALWVGVFFLAREWYRELPNPQPVDQRSEVERQQQPPLTYEATFGERVSAWRPGADKVTALFAGALVLSLLGVGGGRMLFWLLLPKGNDPPRHERVGEVRTVRRPDGTELHVEISGKANGPTVVLTHGWGANATEWYYLRRQLAANYRVIAWDLPGLGRSKSPDNKDFSLGKLATDLKAVLDETTSGPVVLVGHSIGGMISMTFAKLFPQELGRRVVGMALAHTTPTNPLRTMPNPGLHTALQKPVIEPLCHAMKVVSPLIWLMNTMSYLNGSQHWSMFKSAFSYSATWGQLEFVTRFVLQVWPANYGRGGLGMFHYDASDALGRMRVPTLVIGGDRDKVTKHDASEWIVRDIPGATLKTLSPGGHMGLISKHEEFDASVEGFLPRCFATVKSAAA